MTFEIRPETPSDHARIRLVHERAFAPSTEEAELVDALRASGAHEPDLCLVALSEGEVVGHIGFSRAMLDSGHGILALAPMGVLPELQRRGAGAGLVREGLRRAAETGFPLVVEAGHPAYYPRFGFEAAGSYGIRAPFDIPPEAWMVHALPAYDPSARGVVAYAEPFGL